MELKLRDNNTIICDDEELKMIQTAMDYYTQHIIKKNKGKNENHPDIIKATKYDFMCESLGIEGYGYN